VALPPLTEDGELPLGVHAASLREVLERFGVGLRQVETNPANYHLSAAGVLAEIDRMQLEVREYLSFHPGELKAGA